MALVNMKMSPKEAKEEVGLATDAADAPEYPWGLTIDLCDESLTQLGITTLPAVGTKLSLQALVTVTRVSASETQGGTPSRSVGLQITDMALAPPTTSRSSDELAAAMYPTSKG